MAGLYTAQEGGPREPWACYKVHPQWLHPLLCSPIFSCLFPGLADSTSPVGTADQSSYPIYSGPAVPPPPTSSDASHSPYAGRKHICSGANGPPLVTQLGEELPASQGRAGVFMTQTVVCTKDSSVGSSRASGQQADYGPSRLIYFLLKYLFNVWLHWVFVAAGGIVPGGAWTL